MDMDTSANNMDTNTGEENNNSFVNILATGDSSKSLYMKPWGIQRFRNTILSNCNDPASGASINVTIWDLAGPVNNTNRMFFADDIDFCLIFLDMPLRKLLSQDGKRLTSVVEYIHNCKVYTDNEDILCIIVRDSSDDYLVPLEFCQLTGVATIVLERRDISKLQNLADQLAIQIYQKRSK